MAPGVNRLGRETGTVPKTKTPNNSGRDNAMGVSRTSRSNIPNNLTTQDWQSASGPSTNRTRKNSNTRASLLDYYDPSDGRIAHENSRFASSENQDQCGSVNKVCGEINGIEASPPTISVRRDCVRRPPRNVMPDTENKSNITKMNGAVLKTADSSRCNELRMRLEESQKKLQAMQEHQAALQALQQQTQQQLKEARAAQSTLLARTAAAAAAAATTTASSMNSDEDPNPETLRSNLDTIRDRLYALQMYEQRNPDKLQELQTKKERMDHLVAEFQTETNGAVGPAAASLQSGREKSGESSKDGSEAGDDDGNNSDIECDVQRVRHKMAQLSAMRAQLRRLQNMVDSGLQDTEMTGVQDSCPVHVEEIDGEEVEEEEAVNIRRQRQGKGRSVSRTNSTSSTATKPDNISQASVGHVHESELRIEKKTQKLREAKTKLHQLQKLLTTVMDLRSRGEPVPEHYLQILEEETTRVDQEQAAEAVQAAQEARAQQQANMDRDREGATALIPITGAGPTQESPEVTLEMVQAMALELQTQTQCLKEEKERLMRARQEIGNISRELPYREKKTNTQMLLQAKRRELEELMRKDQGQSSAVNQDICSEVSAGKSDTAGFSYIGEGTSAATWGGSTQGTLDDLAERDDDVQEQSAGYSSDEAQDDDESNQHYLGSQRKHPQRNTTSSSSNNNNSNNNNNNNAAVSIKKESLAQSTSTNRETLSMSLESGVFGGSQCGNVNSNAGSISGTFPPPQSLTGLAPQRTGPRNVWRKSSTDSSATLPRAVWTPSSQHPNTVDELATNANTTAVNTTMSHNENESNASNITQVNQSQSTTSSQNNWWQQQAMQLQSQLDATNNLYQSLLLEQQQQQQNLACWPQPPALAHLPGFRGPLPGAPSDAFYQQLLAATQFQQQQLLLTTLNQCCHLLWMQQREMASLRGIVMSAATHGAGGAPWLQQGSAGGAPGLLSAHASSASPVPALNNQVPPGNRANNYWDNFRSYSRQNLLSTSTKSNEGVSHSPSPLVDRSRNTLRNSAGLAQPHPSQHATYPMPDQGLPLNLSRKEKLNIERYHTVPDNYALPSGGIPDLAELQYPQSLPNNQYLSANMQVEHQQIGARALPSSVSNNMSSSDGRGTSSWQNRPSTRSYRTQRGMNCKRKNPRLPPAAATEHPLSSSSVASTPQDRGSRKHRDALCHRSGRSLFDVLSESVYTEVAALIAVNESRPHFLIQLFRDLQMVSSDPLRQRTLQSIHELVSRYLSEASGGPEGSHMHQNMKACKSKEPTLNDSLVSSDDDDNTKMRASATVTVPSAHTPPRNAAWNTHDDMSLPNVLQGHNEWELEAVLEDLLPFLKGHLDEICSPALLDAVRQQAVQLMLAQTQSHCRHNMPGSTHQPAGGYFQGQLDALLEDGLNKFQGCRLRDVCEDLLMVITDILQSELTFLKLVDTVRREVDESSEDTCKNPTTSEEPSNSVHTLQLSVESAAQAFPPPDVNCQNRLESLGSAEGYNGDLAEADQSHHEEATGGGSPQQIEDVAGAIVPEDSDDDGLLEIMQNDVLRPEENQDGLAVALSREDCEEHAKTEAEDEWAVEQDREQGLDRVPTRLTDEIDGQDRPSMLQTNHSDASSNP
ncbi:hypothetical protein R5R35_000866 [Gryllus longicercus]|uniref:Pericentriolar material 1 protein C-terminal domain-containing protein n=1 Tax=Gryllus longicercus TaxID=2509291 RepID=A0AAN9VT43_9ORTH